MYMLPAHSIGCERVYVPAWRLLPHTEKVCHPESLIGSTETRRRVQSNPYKPLNRKCQRVRWPSVRKRAERNDDFFHVPMAFDWPENQFDSLSDPPHWGTLDLYRWHRFKYHAIGKVHSTMRARQTVRNLVLKFRKKIKTNKTGVKYTMIGVCRTMEKWAVSYLT